MSGPAVLFLDQSPAPGGATRVLCHLLAAADPERCRALVACRAGTRTEEQLRATGAHVVPLDLPTVTFTGLPRTWPRLLASTVRSQARLRALLRAEQVAAVHASGLVAALLAALPARSTGVPLVWHVHDVVERRARNRPFVRLAASAASAVVCVSEATRTVLGEFGVGGARLRVVPNAFFPATAPLASPLAGLEGDPSRPLVLAVGHVTPLKGQHVLVEAALNLRRQFPDLLVAVAGEPATAADDSYLERLRKLVAREGAERHFAFLGFRSDVPALLERAWVLAHPSTQEETFGLAPLEAMAAGVPVVASRIGGLPEVVEDGETGLLVEPGRSAPLASALAALLGDPERRARMGAAGRRAVAERFAPSRMLRGLDGVFEQILGRGIFRDEGGLR